MTSHSARGLAEITGRSAAARRAANKGIQTSRSLSGSPLPGVNVGATPTTVNGSRFSWMVRPITWGSASKVARQAVSLSTATI